MIRRRGASQQRDRETERPALIIWFAVATVPRLRPRSVLGELFEVPDPLVRILLDGLHVYAYAYAFED